MSIQNDQGTRRYSESFKLKILSELHAEKYTKRELSWIYGIQSSTVKKWIKKYDRKDLMNTRIMIENKDEIVSAGDIFINVLYAAIE